MRSDRLLRGKKREIGVNHKTASNRVKMVVYKSNVSSIFKAYILSFMRYARHLFKNTQNGEGP